MLLTVGVAMGVYSSVGADVVHLKSGGTLEGTLTDEGASYRVEF